MLTFFRRYNESPVPLVVTEEVLRNFYSTSKQAGGSCGDSGDSGTMTDAEIASLVADFDSSFIVKSLLQKYGDPSIIRLAAAAAAATTTTGGKDEGEEEAKAKAEGRSEIEPAAASAEPTPAGDDGASDGAIGNGQVRSDDATEGGYDGSYVDGGDGDLCGEDVI
jgi:hypothetical protein